MFDDDRREPWGSEGFTLNACLMLEGVSDDDGCRDSTLFQFNRVVQTARRARPSIANCCDDHVNLFGDLFKEGAICRTRETRFRVVPHTTKRVHYFKVSNHTT